MPCAFLLLGAAPAPDLSSADYASDARSLARLIADNYAYLDDLPGGAVPSSPQLTAERDAVHDHDSLLHYAEDMIAALADHHALTGSSFKDDWGIVPSYADIWIVKSGDAYVVDAVKDGSIAAKAGVRVGERLVKADGQPIDAAVAVFWSRMGLQPVGERAPFAARVIATGRRDRPRVLTFAGPQGERTLTLDSLYKDQPDRPALTVTTAKGVTTIRFNNSIGDLGTIKAFDAVMASVPAKAPVVIDVSDVPSGGTTAIARAVMGWFVTRPMPYQMHQLPSEERETGIRRQWVEYVLPRVGKYHPGPVSVRAGRWTGSMGEGLAVGFLAIGKPVCGGRMAGLKGAVYDFDLPKTGLRVKFPAERIYTVAGAPREKVVLPRCG
ncbi:MAG: peptidase S41 [Sphingomonas sp.]|uniref:S41 family peptidase n=1 Tax=Sphingomonas sp. TaxID=28214 RepID=UPI001209438A|nr:PDZ domain-containing protein [Sphingomonas sp.]THD35388.1 MAG: peptidase S41 [Sphingomonas sp.]